MMGPDDDVQGVLLGLTKAKLAGRSRSQQISSKGLQPVRKLLLSDRHSTWNRTLHRMQRCIGSATGRRYLGKPTGLARAAAGLGIGNTIGCSDV